MTEKLYYTDSHMFAFTARVLECRELPSGFALILDRTAFFPEGGGQAFDTGFIGSARVLSVREKDGELLHFADAPVSPGESLECAVDAEQRLRRMQNHSGEHIFSGLAHREHGFENVGFHMGAECMTLDFSGELGAKELARLETLANQAVRADLPVKVWFPEPVELVSLEYRSKRELAGSVRIVEIPGIDRCACCAPHVSRTGEIGLIKVLDAERHRGGTRVSLVCGMDALDDYRLRQNSAAAVSEALSVKRGEIALGVERMLREQEKLKERTASLSMELARLRARDCASGADNFCTFEPLLDEPALRELVNLCVPKCRGLAAAFSGSDGEGWRYIIGSSAIDLRKAAREINEGIGGKGGGSSEMLQGRALRPASEIQIYIKNFKLQTIMSNLYNKSGE